MPARFKKSAKEEDEEAEARVEGGSSKGIKKNVRRQANLACRPNSYLTSPPPRLIYALLVFL